LSHQPSAHIIKPIELDIPTNTALANIFLLNSPDITSNEMNLHSFLNFCSTYDLLIPRLCSLNDCKIIFQKTLTIGKENEQINQFILFDKRIQFVAFKDILLPLLANQREETVQELIQIILSKNQIDTTQQREGQLTSPMTSFGG
jgi:hypothetical protein